MGALAIQVGNSDYSTLGTADLFQVGNSHSPLGSRLVDINASQTKDFNLQRSSLDFVVFHQLPGNFNL
jgi:hypothetical protein